MKAGTSAVALVLVAILAAVPAAAQEPIQSGFGQGAYAPGSGVTDPVLIKEVRPNYTSTGLRARVEGVVELEVIVLANGTVGDVRITKSLDKVFGLDEEAVLAAKKWLFRPGTVKGVAVPTLVTLILEFRVARNPVSVVETPVQRGGASAPQVIKEVKPAYPAGVSGVRGVVELEGVVAPDGRVTGVKVAKSADSRFDAEAIAAAQQWLFRPGYMNGVAVPTTVTLILEFQPPGGGTSAPAATPMRPGSGVSDPKLLKEVRPNYTEAAMRQKIQGLIELEAVVDVDGSVTQVRVSKSLDNTFGLDQSAIEAARQWKFEPGRFEGKPVPVLVTLILEFRLRK